MKFAEFSGYGVDEMGRAGRKRKVGVREPNGRIKRDANRDEGLHAAAVRARVHGLPVKDARDPRAENALGRWCLRGVIDQEQHAAGVAFLESYDRYKLALLAPDALKRGEGSRMRGDVSEDYADWCQGVRKAWDDAVNALTRANARPGHRHLTLYAAVGHLVLNGVEVVHLVEDVRAGLDVLSVHYRLTRRQ